jgi:hypothetical protein
MAIGRFLQNLRQRTRSADDSRRPSRRNRALAADRKRRRPALPPRRPRPRGPHAGAQRGVSGTRDAIHLTTYRSVGWNKPFYERRGFTEVARGNFTPALRRQLLTEINLGHLVWQRALMVR